MFDPIDDHSKRQRPCTQCMARLPRQNASTAGGLGRCACGAGYSAAFAQLHNAAKPDVDPLPEVPDGAAFLAKQLAAAAAAAPGQMAARVSTTVLPEQQAQLQALLQAAGVALA